MNKLQQVGKTLEHIAPIAYGVFSTEQDPPYLLMIDEGDTAIYADNKRHLIVNNITVEHYFNHKDLNIDKQIDDALENAGLCFSVSGDSYINSEKLWVRYITIQFTTKEENVND